MSPSEVKIGDFIIPSFDIHSRIKYNAITLIKNKKYKIIQVLKLEDHVVLVIAGEDGHIKIRYNENTHKSYHIFSLKEERLKKLKEMI